MSLPEIRVIKHNPLQQGLATYFSDVVYSKPTEGLELKLHLLLPQESTVKGCMKKFPCIVFLQGSSWTYPWVYYEIPQLSRFAQDGFIVASVIHRCSLDGYPSPAFLIDYKCAIRFLRTHADQYHIDSTRIAAWGTSSGGNTALLAALTADDAVYKNGEWADESDAVQSCVACFPPTDVPELFKTWEVTPKDNIEHARDIAKSMFGDDESTRLEKMREISPIYRICPGAKYPPFLLLHGDADKLVSYEHGERMFKALCKADARCDFIRVEGAGHEDDFWSQEVLNAIKDFLLRTL